MTELTIQSGGWRVNMRMGLNAVLILAFLHCAQPVFAQQAAPQAQTPQVQAQATQMGATADAAGQGCWAEAKCGNLPSAPPQPASLQNAPPQDVKVAVVSIPEEMHLNWFDIATIVIATLTIILSFAIYVGNTMHSRYVLIDDKLNEILAMCISRPNYFNKSFTDGYPEEGSPSDDRYIRYSAYAYVVWNWIEAVYDCYGENEIMESGVWGTILHFKELHKKWFNNCDNQRQFNLHFREFICDIDVYRTPTNWYASINYRKTYWFLWVFVRISQLYRKKY